MVPLKSKFNCLALSMIIHLPSACCSSFPEAAYSSAFNHTEDNNLSHMSPKMIYEITLHGLLLWVSLGFLMPIGILIIKMCNREKCGTRLKVYFYVHLIVQMFSVLLATAGAIMSIKTFENSFNNKHQRIGLALYGAIWVQTVLGFLRPQRGNSKRGLWYFLHWILGTVICIVGILNIYTGLEAYHKRTKRSVSLWKILFTAEIVLMAFFYLFQDKWDYIQKQGVFVGDNGQIRPSDQENSERGNASDLWREPCSKTNALKNLFK